MRPPPDLNRKIQALLQAGLAAQRAGQAAQAEQAYRQVLALDPRQPDALQLWGLLAKSQGHLDQARDLMERSLSAQPRQPNVLSNLGNLHLAAGHAEQALSCYDRALRLAPQDPQLHFHRAKALDGLDRPADALEALTRAQRLKPDHPPTIALLASLMLRQGAFAEAEAAARLAVALRPDDARSWNNLGLALRRQDRYGEAEPAYRRALALQADMKEVWLNLGNLLVDLDRQAEALAAYRRAIDLDPLYAEAHENLARQLWRMGQVDRVLDSYAAAVTARPEDPEALALAAAGKAQFGYLEPALADLDKALAAGANAARHRHLRARLLLRLNRPTEALPLLAALAADAPADAACLQDLCTAQFRSGATAAAAETAQALLRRDPYDQFALAYLGTARRLLGDPAGEALFDYDRTIASRDLPAPSPWTEMADFLADLRAVLTPLHNTVNAPLHLTLKHGSQTAGNLLEVHSSRPIAALRGAILAAVADFRAGLPALPDHPFHGRARPGQEIKISGSWSSRLTDRGYHTHHIHPEGWISGVFYIDVPPAAADAERQEGWLTFGRANIGPEIDLPAVRAVQPVPGRLVLFPSYLWHGTVPFRGNSPRMTIAFDIAPV